MKHLYFVRHGLSMMNKQGLQGVWSGSTNTPLAPEGRVQARMAGQSLKGTPIDCIVTSPLQRAHDTAQLIAKEIGYDPNKIIVNELFMERDFGPLEGTDYRPHAVNLDATEGVEHSEELTARIAKGLEFLESLNADNILVAAHGSVGRALRSLVEVDTTFHSSPRFPNGEVVKLL